MKKIIKMIFLLLMISFILVWGISLARCEILTKLHSDEFEDKNLFMENTMIDEIAYIKILDYSDKQVRIYCVSEENSMGNILVYTKQDGKWEYAEWDTIWSKSGSADEAIWPYWWH